MAERGRVGAATLLAIGALAVHLASVFLPLHPGSIADPSAGDAFPAGLSTRLTIGFAITVFFIDVVALVGLALLAGGRSTIAAGVFLAAAIVETLIAIAGPFYTSTEARPLILMALRFVVALLLFGASYAAAARGRQAEGPPVPPPPPIV